MIDTAAANDGGETKAKSSAKPSLHDKIHLNDKFTSKQFRVIVPIPELEEIYKKQKVV